MRRLHLGCAHLFDLVGHIGGLGVEDLFGKRYGPDLVDTWEGGRLFYDRILADAGVSPAHALVVDDSNRSVSWATEAGATAVLISSERPESTDPCEVLKGLSALPDFLAKSRG